MDMTTTDFDSCASERTKLLRDIQRYGFSAYDLGLYLDTHPSDKEAISMHIELVKKLEAATEAFQTQFGPLTMNASTSPDTWSWLSSPWPWEAQV